ncbi:MAG: SemiSWEET family transporter [Actinomycetota bacterium]|nr:SemiSWEET family transporter [Actinomycetota bacterium]
MESTLAIAAATWAIAMALGPVLQIRKIVEHRSSRSISIGYFVVLLVGFVLWLAYGIAASNLVLIVPNIVAALVISATIIVALRYRRLPRADSGTSP